MKPLVASLLFLTSGVGVLGTKVEISGIGREPKEPPSTALAVRGEITTSEETKTQTIEIAPATTTTVAAPVRKNSIRPASRRYNISKDPTKRCPQFEEAFRRYGLVPVEVFSYIAWRESRCQPKAFNGTLNRDGSEDYGLLQINSSWTTVTSKVCKSPWGKMRVLFKVDCNLKVAKFLLDNTESGLGNWRVYKES